MGDTTILIIEYAARTAVLTLLPFAWDGVHGAAPVLAGRRAAHVHRADRVLAQVRVP